VKIQKNDQKQNVTKERGEKDYPFSSPFPSLSNPCGWPYDAMGKPLRASTVAQDGDLTPLALRLALS
jgi:hypothetical protein